MKFVYPDIDCVFDLTNGRFNTLVIENQDLFVRFLQDIHGQLNGCRGLAVLSQADMPVAFDRYAELLDRFVPFEMNRKPLLNKISTALEQEAFDEIHYAQSTRVMQEVEQLLADISFCFSCDLRFPKISLGGIIKSVGIELNDDYGHLTERLIDYMELVCEFERNKLFILVNLRSYVSDEKLLGFAQTAISHGFEILALDSSDRPRLDNELRWTVDADLCEFS